MKAVSVVTIKKELKHRSSEELMEMCLRLSKFKKENKELLTYLLFEAHDESGYIETVKAEIDQQNITWGLNPQNPPNTLPPYSRQWENWVKRSTNAGRLGITV